MIKIDFEMTDGTHTYRDALHLADDHQLSDEQVEEIKQARFARWLDVIMNPVETVHIPEEPIAEDSVIDQGV